MQVVAEASIFTKQAAKLFTLSEKEAIINFLATNPLAGDIIPHTAVLEKCACLFLAEVNVAVPEWFTIILARTHLFMRY